MAATRFRGSSSRSSPPKASEAAGVAIPGHVWRVVKGVAGSWAAWEALVGRKGQELSSAWPPPPPWPAPPPPPPRSPQASFPAASRRACWRPFGSDSGSVWWRPPPPFLPRGWRKTSGGLDSARAARSSSKLPCPTEPLVARPQILVKPLVHASRNATSPPRTGWSNEARFCLPCLLPRPLSLSHSLLPPLAFRFRDASSLCLFLGTSP
mmetsp:Transcript_61203/g.138470  ORF Transcript_61203/g.138470 Transcript_61203/m.138470 type:complete len:209 (+) Transcript_61203:2634-3260(+)